MEGEEWDCEECHEAVYAGALVRGEDLPPLHGPVGQDHRHVERHHRGQNVVQVPQSYHRYNKV